MSEFSLSELKKALLSAKPSPIKTEIFRYKESLPSPADGG